MTFSCYFYFSLFVAFVGAAVPISEPQSPFSSSSLSYSGLCEGYYPASTLLISETSDSRSYRVAELSNGKVVVIYGHEIGNASYIGGKLINSSGIVEVAQGNLSTWDAFYCPFNVAPLEDGEFVVVWTELINSERYIRYQIFDGDFQNVSGVYRTTKLIDARHILVFRRAGSGFGIAWRNGAELVYASLFNRSGTEIVSDRLVADINDEYEYHRESYDIAPIPDGKFVIVYYDDSDSVIKSQLLDTDLSAIGTANVAASDACSWGSEPLVVKLRGYGLVLTYLRSVDYNKEVSAQYLNDDATLNGSRIEVNTYTSGTQEWTALAATNDGGFVSMWESIRQYNSWTLFSRVFGEDREPKGTEFTIMEDYNDGSVAAMGVGFISCGRDYQSPNYVVKCSIFKCTDLPNNSSWSYSSYYWGYYLMWYAIWYGPFVVFFGTIIVIAIIVVVVVVLAILAAISLSVFINRKLLTEGTEVASARNPIFIGEMDEIVVVPTQRVMGVARQPSGYIGHPGAPPPYRP